MLEYWEGIRDRADRIDAHALIEEKLGYIGPLDFEDWLAVTHLKGLSGLEDLWTAEQALFGRPLDLKALADRRIASINHLKQQYEKD